VRLMRQYFPERNNCKTSRLLQTPAGMHTLVQPAVEGETITPGVARGD
jgi:hypothetical protein